MQKIASSLIELIGGTPLIELKTFAKKRNLAARLLVKAECFNPGGSSKDRAALFMIEDAERRGLIKEGATIVEPTSGNTGIGLAWLGAVKGYKVVLVMPETMSVERRRLAAVYGARIVLTNGAGGMRAAIEKAEQIARETPNSFVPSQFDNPANAEAHRRTTAEEILRDTDKKVDFFVAGVGTGGTITGVGEVLKKEIPALKAVAVEPFASPVLSGGKAGAHKLQGIGAGFVPSALNRDVIDEIVKIDDAEAIETARALAREEGLLCGISSGAALAAAVKIAARSENAGKTVLALLPDTGERYLSTQLFDFD